MSEPARELTTQVEDFPVANSAAAIIQVIERAATNPDVDVDKMERLLEMHERVMDRNARASYAAALAEMQTKLPVVIERGKADKSSYALFEDIQDAVRPVLQQYGFALSFRTGREDGLIVVTGVLTHRDGHTEQTSIHLPADTSGSKNAVQAVGSSTSYGKRYTTIALLNLTTRGEDDDGKAGGAKVISTQQVQQVKALMNEVKADPAAFLEYLHADSVDAIPVAKFQMALQALNAKKQALLKMQGAR